MGRVLTPPRLFDPRSAGISRRRFLGGVAGSAAVVAAAAGKARASTVAAADRRFLFVYTMGGWDVTRVFAPLFGSEYVDMEPDAALASAGDIPYVDHPSRPSVRSFMDTYGSRLAVVNGYYVSSISHSAATRMMLTGTVDGSVADWPTRLAAWRADKHILPFLVVAGPTFSGAYGVDVGHAGTTGQLQGLGDATILAHSDLVVPTMDTSDISRVDALLAQVAARRAAEITGAQAQARMTSFGTALTRAQELKGLTGTINLDRGTTFSDQVALAARVLSQNISRCVAVSHPLAESNVEWDSHADNDITQTALFESLFAELASLCEVLDTTPGAQAATLADETVVVVLSEMGRTPKLNGSIGKDHWPFGSAMVFGPGVRGGHVYGGFDEGLYGSNVDLTTGEVTDTGVPIGPNILGAALLELGDVDPRAEGLVDDPLSAIIDA